MPENQEEKVAETTNTSVVTTDVTTNQKPDVLTLWESVQVALNITLSDLIFNTFIKTTEAENLTEDSIDLVCNSDHAKDKIIKNYASLIQNTVNEVGKRNYKINYVVRRPDPKVKKSKGRKLAEELETPLFGEITPKETSKETQVETTQLKEKAGLVPQYTFANYVMGANNQLAYSVAWAVANNPGVQYNPVFLYSGVGLGKTHLIHAIGNHIIDQKPHLKVVYTTSEKFTNELVETIQAPFQAKKTLTERFRKKFREADVLLIDDIQFMVGKDSTQEEFFHTFNELQMHKKQIVITSDRPPKDFNNLEERLTSRFGSGITTDIQSPTIEMRIAILRNRRDLNQDEVTDEMIDFVAAKVDTNIRELEGAYIQVLTHIKSQGLEYSVENAGRALGQIIPEKKEKANPNEIMNAVCRYFSVTKADIKGPRRTKDFVIPRQIAMYLLKEMTGTPLIAIGELLGGRDHTTIIHGADKIDKEIRKIPRMEQDVRNIKQLIYMD